LKEAASLRPANGSQSRQKNQEDAMQTDAVVAPASKGALWAGWIMTALPALFLLADAVGKLIQPEAVVRGTVELGYPESIITGLGVVLLGSVVLHLIPPTAMLGAILLTGYLGGAVASHVRLEHPWATHVLFPVYFAVLIWGGLYLRDPRVSTVVQTGVQTSGSKGMKWAGWIVTALPVLLLMMSAGMSFAGGQEVEDGMKQFGYPESVILGLGVTQLVCALLYAIPRTSIWGAILLTGYLGGAVATHVRVGDAFFMAIGVGVLVWLGLYLRDPRVRALIPLRKSA
jgi:hypothetical protein